MLTGLCSITFRGLAADEIIALCVRGKIDALEWGSDVHVPAGDTHTARRVAQRCLDAGIATLSYGSYLGIGPAGPTELLDAAEQVFDCAEALGSTTVRIWTQFGVTPDAETADRDRVVETTRLLADAAAHRGLSLATEFHSGTLTHTAASAMNLLHQVDRANLSTYWQPDPGLSSEQALDELHQVGSRLGHVHVFNWGPGGIAERLALADGTQLWPSALAFASQQPSWGAGPRVAYLEYVRDDSTDQLVADAATLRGWLAAAADL